jgi:uncharacterized protein YqgC (DUF456 family)
MGWILAASLVVLLDTLWVALILVGLPGTWLMIATAALAEWWTPETQLFLPATLVTAVVLGAVGELIEFLASAGGAKKAGAGRSGALGALVGGIAGAIAGTILIPVPLIGSLAGGAAGAFAGSAAMEHGGGRELREALRVGRGAAVGHVFGILGKLATGVAVWVLLAVAAFVP